MEQILEELEVRSCCADPRVQKMRRKRSLIAAFCAEIILDLCGE